MTEPARIAEILFEDSFATPAAILVALIDDRSLRVLPVDRAHLGTLRGLGCLDNIAPTPLGRRVGLILCNTYGLEAWSARMAIN